MFFRKIMMLVLTCVIIFIGCTSTVVESKPREIKVLISTSSGFVHNTLFELIDEEVLEVTVFDAWWYPYPFTGDIIFDNARFYDFYYEQGVRLHNTNTYWVYSSGKKVLSQRQLNNIWDLTAAVVRNGAGLKFEQPYEGHPTYVWVSIDGEIYWSYYVSDIDRIPSAELDGLHELIDRDLLMLVYYLIDISPIQVIPS